MTIGLKGLRSGSVLVLLVALAILFASAISTAQGPEGPAEIPAGMAEFENSPFCQEYILPSGFDRTFAAARGDRLLVL
jgi:hypothetical protein